MVGEKGSQPLGLGSGWQRGLIPGKVVDPNQGARREAEGSRIDRVTCTHKMGRLSTWSLFD